MRRQRRPKRDEGSGVPAHDHVLLGETLVFLMDRIQTYIFIQRSK